MTQPDGREVAGPPVFEPKRRRKAPPPILVIPVTILLILGAAGFLLTRGGGSGPPTAAGPPPSTSPPPTDLDTTVAKPNPLEQRQLQGFADTVALHIARGNTEVASAMVTHLRTLTGCPATTAYTGGINGADLADPAARAEIKASARERGWDFAFGHKGSTWIVVAQVCEEP